jgi:hypothetical protein
MASREEILVVSPLKVPVTQVIDLTVENPIPNPTELPNIDVKRESAHVEEITDGSEEDSWEDESLYEEVLDNELDHSNTTQGLMAPWSSLVASILNHTSPDVCTPEEGLRWRKRLRQVGEDQFILETIEEETITAKKLCTAFGVRPPSFLEGRDDVRPYD